MAKKTNKLNFKKINFKELLTAAYAGGSIGLSFITLDAAKILWSNGQTQLKISAISAAIVTVGFMYSLYKRVRR